MSKRIGVQCGSRTVRSEAELCVLRKRPISLMPTDILAVC